MFETVRYEGRRRLRGTAILTAGVGAYAGFIVWYFTVLEGVDYEDVFEDLPPAMLDAFGIQNLSTIEGFLGAQLFSFIWLLGLGLYFAYVAGGLVARDIETVTINPDATDVSIERRLIIWARNLESFPPAP